MPTLTSRKYGGFKQKMRRFSKLHEISMAQNLIARGREVAKFGCQNGQKCLKK